MTKLSKTSQLPITMGDYQGFLGDITALLETARHQAARSVNAVLTATYWEIGRRIVEFQQKGKKRAEYGETLLKRLSSDLTRNFGKGYSIRNLRSFRAFYLDWPIPQTLSAESSKDGKSRVALQKRQTLSAEFQMEKQSRILPLPWSAYVRLISVKDAEARAFYEAEALRGGWSVRQLDRQISSQFYERTLISKNKAAMLKKGAKPKPGDMVTPEEEIKDPYVLEFLGLRDEYSERMDYAIAFLNLRVNTLTIPCMISIRPAKRS